VHEYVGLIDVMHPSTLHDVSVITKLYFWKTLTLNNYCIVCEFDLRKTQAVIQLSSLSTANVCLLKDTVQITMNIPTVYAYACTKNMLFYVQHVRVLVLTEYNLICMAELFTWWSQWAVAVRTSTYCRQYTCV